MREDKAPARLLKLESTGEPLTTYRRCLRRRGLRR
jgi:hypothetical protein